MGTRKSGPRPMSATAAALPGIESSDLPADPTGAPAPTTPETPDVAGASEDTTAVDPSSPIGARMEPNRYALAEHKVTSPTAPTKYTVLLDEITDREFEGLAQHAASMLGRIRTEGTRRGRYPSRSDVVRALVHLAHTNHELRDRMLDQIEKDVSS